MSYCVKKINFNGSPHPWTLKILIEDGIKVNIPIASPSEACKIIGLWIEGQQALDKRSH